MEITMHALWLVLSDVTFLVWLKNMAIAGFIIGFISSIINSRMFDLVYVIMDGTRYAVTFAFYTTLGYFFYLYMPSALFPFIAMILALIFFSRLENRYGYFESVEKKYRLHERWSGFSFSFKLNIGK